MQAVVGRILGYPTDFCGSVTHFFLRTWCTKSGSYSSAAAFWLGARRSEPSGGTKENSAVVFDRRATKHPAKSARPSVGAAPAPAALLARSIGPQLFASPAPCASSGGAPTLLYQPQPRCTSPGVELSGAPGWRR